MSVLSASESKNRLDGAGVDGPAAGHKLWALF